MIPTGKDKQTNLIKNFGILNYFVVGSFALILMDIILSFEYWQKSLVKIVIFAFIPLIIKYRYSDLQFFKANHWKSKVVYQSILYGLVIYFLILGSFILIQPFLSFEAIKTSLLNNVNVTRNNFIYIALYISIINSWIEEFFFRGFGFYGVKPILGKIKTYLISSMFFAIYHIGIIGDWAHPILVIISIIGLFFVGIFFILLNERNNNFVSSWMVHMFANLAINTIGLHMFGIIQLPFLT
jgi:uncharacterized protein